MMIEAGMDTWPKSGTTTTSTEILESEKIEAYWDLLAFVRKFSNPEFQKVLKQNQKRAREVGQEWGRHGLKMALFGSGGVIEKYVDWRTTARDGAASIVIVKKFGDVILEMRKDLGLEGVERDLLLKTIVDDLG